MERIRTTELTAHTGERVRLQGWLHQFRELGKVNFLILRDGWGTAQAVVEDVPSLERLRGVQVESIVEVLGVATAMPQAPGGVELQQTEVRVLAPVDEPPPVEINKREMNAALDTFLEHAVIGLRHPKRRAVLRLEAALVAGFRAALDARGFTEIQSPKILGSFSEGGADVFRVQYFDREAYLAQSPQLYKQTAVGIFERVFEVGPVFRAEPHATARHLAEYVSLDVEFGFVEDHHTVMVLLRDVLAAMLAEANRRCATELSLLGVSLPAVPERIPEIWFPEAQRLLLDRFGVDCRGEPDLAPEHERLLARWAQDEHGAEFVFVTGFPTAKRPFYTHPDPVHPEFTNSFDLLFRGIELVTGGQRLHRYADYLAAMSARSISPEPFAEYLEAFRHGMPPHGGFAIGLERFAMQILGLSNVRLAALFPRDLTRVRP
jgi:nondiscriminating aspartyl-tRNA synthetase